MGSYSFQFDRIVFQGVMIIFCLLSEGSYGISLYDWIVCVIFELIV